MARPRDHMNFFGTGGDGDGWLRDVKAAPRLSLSKTFLACILPSLLSHPSHQHSILTVTHAAAAVVLVS